MPKFKLNASYKPTGDQLKAIAELVKGFKEGNQFQKLLGLQTPVRHLQWQMSFKNYRSQPLQLPTTRH